MKQRAGLVVLFGILLVVGAACGGSDDETGSTDPDASSPSTSTASTATTAPTTTAAGVEPPIELAGTRWKVTDYNQGGGTITNVWLTDVTIEFDDGTFSGSSGCNTYGGGWSADGPYDPFEAGQRDQADGQALTLSNLAWTEIGCEDERIMEQENEILALLRRAGRWVLIDGELHLRDAEGVYLFQAEPA